MEENSTNRQFKPHNSLINTKQIPNIFPVDNEQHSILEMQTSNENEKDVHESGEERHFGNTNSFSKHSESSSSFVSNESNNIFENDKFKPLINLIKKNYDEESKEDKRKNLLKSAKQKIWKVVRRYKMFNQGKLDIPKFENITKVTETTSYVMHPELSPIRTVIDVIVCILFIIDLFISPFLYFVKLTFPVYSWREGVFDIIFLFDIISHFFNDSFYEWIF